MTEILLAKLRPPRPVKGIIQRPRLLELLDKLDERKLTLLLAPAGFGKTVAMLQLAAETRRGLVWYQLDGYDNDPAVFLQYLITGIHRQIPAFGLKAQQLIAEGDIENRLRLIVTDIINGLSQQTSHPLLLVFDDFQAISQPLLHRFMQDFLEHLPACVHVMIAGRALPPLNIVRLKTAGEVLSVGAEELRFTPDETEIFLVKEAPQLSIPIREFLEQKVNGWPTAVKLLTDSASGADIPLQINSGTAEIIFSVFLLYKFDKHLSQENVMLKDFGEYAKGVTTKIKEHVEKMAEERERQLIYLNSPKISKEETARKTVNLLRNSPV